MRAEDFCPLVVASPHLRGAEVQDLMRIRRSIPGLLEHDLQTELNLPLGSPGISLCAGVVAEAAESDNVTATAWVRGSVAELSEVYVIEAVVALYAELRAISLFHMPNLSQREVPILIARPGENAAASVTQCPVGRRRQNTAVLNVTGTSGARQRLNRQLLLRWIAVRGLCRRQAGLQDVRWRGGQGRAAGSPTVAGNGVGAVAAKSGSRTGVVPGLPDSVVGAWNGIVAFGGPAPIVVLLIVRGPGKAGLVSPNGADLPAFQHLPGRLLARDAEGR